MELVLQYYEKSEGLGEGAFQNAHLITEASKKLGALYLGDLTAAQDIEYLKENKISCVLTVADIKALSLPKSIVSSYLRIPADDSVSFKLNAYYDQCFKFIQENRSRGKNVLVHCMAGISRSAAIVMGYLMATENMNLESAYKFVRKKRTLAFPNMGFVKQLKDYEKQLKLKALRKQKTL